MASAPAADFGTTWLNRWWHNHRRICSEFLHPGFLLILGLWLACFESTTLAGESVFDTLHLRDRTQCIGVLLGRDPQHAYLAVRRQAMEGKKGAIQTYLRKSDADEEVAYEQLRDRTHAMLQEPQHDAYRFLLEQEHERAARWLSGADRPSSELVILSIPVGNVAKLDLANREYHAMALWSWFKQLDAPESIDAAAVRKGLELEGVDWNRELPDLSSRFQAMPQSGDEWRSRVALVRYSRDREIEFQGTPGMMVRIGDRNSQADVAKLLTQSVQQQSQDLLGELLDGRKPKRRDWRESCQEMLKEEREDYYRASCMDQSIATAAGTVESVFAVRLGTEWKTIWKVGIPIDLNAVSDATQKQIENDPQVRSLLSLVQSLGVGSTENIDQAVKMGAATMQAQSQANLQFQLFRQRYQHRLDLPVLRWDVTSPERRPSR